MTIDQKINVLLADDHSLIRQGMQFLLEDLDFDFEVSNASNLSAVLEIVKSQPIDFLVIDAHFPDGQSISIIPEIKEINPNIKIMVYSGTDEKNNALKYLNAGVQGFVSKMSEEEETKKAIVQILQNGKYMSPEIQNLLIDSLQNPSLINPLNRLTEREREIAEMYGKGLGNLEIANALDIKQNTVSTLKKRIFEKLEIENIVELIDILKSH